MLRHGEVLVSTKPVSYQPMSLTNSCEERGGIELGTLGFASRRLDIRADSPRFESQICACHSSHRALYLVSALHISLPAIARRFVGWSPLFGLPYHFSYLRSPSRASLLIPVCLCSILGDGSDPLIVPFKNEW